MVIWALRFYTDLPLSGRRYVFWPLFTLYCAICQDLKLPDKAKKIVDFHVKQPHETENKHVNITPTRVINKRYPYCKVEFSYTALDHDFIPGLATHGKDGFLTPVFFNATVLNKYSQNPDYKLNLFSDTYGSIIKGDEINISFGINRTRKVIMWLGDLDLLPENEQHYLRSENIESDHDLYSEFYDAQLHCVFSEPSLEKRAMHSRASLNNRSKDKFGMELYQLHGEISRVIEGLQRPTFWEEGNVAPVAEALNRIMVESLCPNMLRQQLNQVIDIDESDYKDLKGLKLKQLWLSKCLRAEDASTVMLPFFVLYDFRIFMCHLIPNDRREKMLASIYQRLGLDDANKNFESIYFIDRLT